MIIVRHELERLLAEPPSFMSETDSETASTAVTPKSHDSKKTTQDWVVWAGNSGYVEWWKTRVGDFPTLAPIAKAFLLTPCSAALPEWVFSLLGHGHAALVKSNVQSTKTPSPQEEVVN